MKVLLWNLIWQQGYSLKPDFEWNNEMNQEIKKIQKTEVMPLKEFREDILFEGRSQFN